VRTFEHQTRQMKVKTTIENLITQDTWQLREHRTRCVASVVSATDASGDLAFWNNSSIRRGTSINTCWPALGSLSWYFDILCEHLAEPTPSHFSLLISLHSIAILE
jgi:hypothetical protein